MKLKVEGMTCQGCVKSVTKVIAKQTQADEATVSVSLETKIAEFQADEAQISPIVAALAKAGFEASPA